MLELLQLILQLNSSIIHFKRFTSRNQFKRAIHFSNFNTAWKDFKKQALMGVGVCLVFWGPQQVFPEGPPSVDFGSILGYLISNAKTDIFFTKKQHDYKCDIDFIQ